MILMRKFNPETQIFKVLKYNPEKHQLETTIGAVDPFVGCAIDDHMAESTVGKTYRANGIWSGVFLPNEGEIKEIGE
jgi:hypothetical protein